MRFSCMVYWWQVECAFLVIEKCIKLMLLVYPYHRVGKRHRLYVYSYILVITYLTCMMISV